MLFFPKKNKQLNKIFGLVVALFFSCWFSVRAAEETDLLQQEIIQLTNQERRHMGLSELKESPILNQAALMKGQNMLEENYFAHTSPKGIDPWFWFDKAGYNYKYAGENLAMDFNSASSVHRAWMKSPTHRENIVSEKFSEIGVAVLKGKLDGRETYLAVELFGAISSKELADLRTLLEKENLNLSIKESSVFPWKGSDGRNEALIFAEVSGLTESVNVVIKEKSFPLEKIKDNNYLGLISLENWVPDRDQAVIVATSPLGWKVSELILPSKYFGYIHQNSTKQENIFEEKNEKDNVLAAGINEENGTKLAFSSNLRDGILLFGVLVFCLTIGNIWILEKEDERLLLKSVLE